jgi:zinc/manganese transport system permease protein
MNLSIWDIMAPAFFECLILVGIHSYLGLHVIRRKVIFVDLALAQIAALGTTVGFLFGIMPGSTGAYWFSLVFAFIGAAVFSIARFKNEKIPQEAIIGLTYALAAAISILVIDKAPHGAEHIKEILTGSILWVKWKTIAEAAIVYSLVGIFHFIFRKKFLLISENPEKAEASGINVRFWDFLFYVSFGIVITHSVGTAGVLLVFVFLVVPAITSMMITDVLWKQLVIGWTMGVFVTITGLYISYTADLPSGPTVVAFYGAVLTLVAIVLYLFRAASRKRALTNIGLGLGVTILVIWGISLMGKAFHSENHHEVKAGIITEAPNEAAADFSQMDEGERESYLSKTKDLKKLKSLFTTTDDDFTKLSIAKRIARLNKKVGAMKLISLLKKSELPFFREEVYSEIKNLSEKDFGYDSEKPAEKNKKALDKMLNWAKGLR